MATTCLKCGAENRQFAKFCIECIATLPNSFAPTMLVPRNEDQAAALVAALSVPGQRSADAMPPPQPRPVLNDPPATRPPVTPSAKPGTTPVARKGLWVSVAAFAIALFIGAGGWMIAGAGGWYIYSNASAVASTVPAASSANLAPTHTVAAVSPSLEAPLQTATNTDMPKPAVDALAATSKPLASAEPGAQASAIDAANLTLPMLKPASTPSPAPLTGPLSAQTTALATETAKTNARRAAKPPAAAASASTVTASADVAQRDKMAAVSTPARPATAGVSTSPTLSGPRAQCGSLGFFAVQRCLSEQCAKPGMRAHADCDAVRRQQALMEEKRNPTLSN